MEQNERTNNQPDTGNPADIRAWKAQLIQRLLTALMIVGLLAAIVGTIESVTSNLLWSIPFYWAAYGGVILFVVWRDASYNWKAAAIAILIYVMAFVDFVKVGLAGPGSAFLLVIPFLVSLIYGRRSSIVSLAIGILTMLGFGFAYAGGALPLPNEASGELIFWLSSTFTLLMLGTFIIISHDYLVPRLISSLGASRLLTMDLEAHKADLEQQVAERTASLARRSTQLETSAQVARDAASIQDLEQLLRETVQLISDRFGYYHTGIFLLDDNREDAVLRAASSTGGQRMLARGHRLRVGQVGIVGYVTGKGEPRIALDVGSDAVFFDNPDLPNTRSEIALPLLAHGEIIGALDVQSTEEAAFDEQNVAVLQTLADQIALAINNARLFQEAQQNLEAERRTYGELSRRAWQDLLRRQPRLANRHDPQNLLPAKGQWRAEVKQAVKHGETVIQQESAALVTPIKARGQVIGVIDAHKPNDDDHWTQDEIALIETLTDQLGIALESARLYQETQTRAIQERLVGDVTTRMRESLDVDTVLQTAVREIGKTLGLAEVSVRLGGDLLSAGMQE